MLFAHSDLKQIVFYFIDVREKFIIYGKYAYKFNAKRNFFSTKKRQFDGK